MELKLHKLRILLIQVDLDKMLSKSSKLQPHQEFCSPHQQM